MSKTNAFENSIMKLVFQGAAIANMADNAGSSPLTGLYLSLHTGDPGEAGDQTTSECAYTSYARVSVARSGAGFTVTNNTVSLAANASFPAATGGSETATHFGIGSASSGAGNLYYKGTITPNIAIATGVTPILTTATNGTED